MAYEEKRPVPAAKPHAVTLTERSRLTVTGVEEVVSFHEEEVTVRTVKGTLLIRGEGLRVDNLDKLTGELSVGGEISELCYEDAGPAAKLFARIFYGLCRDIAKLADVLGHTSVDTTRKHYADMTDARRRMAAEHVHLPGDPKFRKDDGT